MSSQAFSRANRLWFQEGRTARAIDAYAEAHRTEPTDPVVAYQYAMALWAVDRFDEARAMLDTAIAHQATLDSSGQRLLEQWRDRMRRPPLERPYPELTPALLDRDRLDANPALVGSWRSVAKAAHQRGMDGLAVYALDRWGGVPIDAEDASDMEAIWLDRDSHQRLLTSLRGSRRAGTRGGRRPDRRPPSEAPPRRAPTGPPVARDLPGQRPRPRPLSLPDLPLELTVDVDPAVGPVGVPSTLLARLRNASPVEQVVNRRMLLNHPGAEGEVLLEVRGPAGYRNRRGFRIRAGPAGNEFYVPLVPGDSLEKSWRLDKYASLDTPGDYVVMVTYHNEADRAPDGRPVAVGKAVGTAGFRRRR